MKQTQSEKSTNKEVTLSDIRNSWHKEVLKRKNNPPPIVSRTWREVIHEYANLIFQLLFAFKFVGYWIFPQPEDAHAILSLSVLMGFEFIMVHSGVMMAAMSRKGILPFVIFYGLFALAFNFAVDDHSILILYLVTVVNRMRYAFSKASAEQVQNAIAFSVFAALIYFALLIFIAIDASNISNLGLTSHYIDTYITPIRKVGGLLTEQPYVSMCFGFLYFSLITLVEFAMFEKNRKHQLIKLLSVVIGTALLFLCIAYFTNKPLFDHLWFL